MPSQTAPEKMSTLRDHVRRRCAPLDAPYPRFALFFSVSDGRRRARTVNAGGDSLEAAWQRGLASLRKVMQAEGLDGRWIRVDWVEDVEATNWGTLKACLAGDQAQLLPPRPRA